MKIETVDSIEMSRRALGVRRRALRQEGRKNRTPYRISAIFGFFARRLIPNARRNVNYKIPPHQVRSILALIALSALLASPSSAQLPSPSPQDPSVLFSLDSLQRVISRRILSDADKKEIRACEREKSQFLKQCRASDSATALVDKRLNEAKTMGTDPNDPAIQALLEKKFALEKACDDAFNALARGKQCLAGEDKRRVALQKALKLDKQYQSMLKKTQVPGPEPL